MNTKINETNDVKNRRRTPNTDQADFNQDDTMSTEAGRHFIASEVLQGGAIGAVAGIAWGSFLGLVIALQLQPPSISGWETVFVGIALGALIGAIISSVLLMVIIRVGSGLQRYLVK